MATAARMMTATGTLHRANSITSSFLLRPFSIAHKSLRINRNIRSPKRLFSCRSLYIPEVQIKEEGQPETLDYRVFLSDHSGKKVSPWHDIPLNLGDGVYNFIVEIPKETSAKMEVATDEPYTLIKQDTKKGKFRYYPYNINWNYGLLPQTWEDPSFANSDIDGRLL